MKALCFGLVSYNITGKVDNFPVEGQTYLIEDKVESGGGFAFDCSILLASWGLETYIASVVGNDTYGDRIKKELNQTGVKTEYLETTFDKQTPFSFILVDKQNGNNTKFDIMPERAFIKKEDWQVEPDYILGDCNEYHAFLTAINKYPNKDNFVFAKKDNLETRELCKYGKYILATLEFAASVTKLNVDVNSASSLVNLYNKLLDKYPRSNIVITLGASGALYTKDKQINMIKGIDVAPSDRSGSTNIFRGAFVYGVSVGYDIEKCIQIANIAAGLSVTKFGTKSSIPALNEVLAYYTKKFQNQTHVAPHITTEQDNDVNEKVEKPVSNIKTEIKEVNSNNEKQINPINNSNPVNASQNNINSNLGNNINNPGINPPSING